MKEPLIDDETMNRMLNALLIMFLVSGLWGWMINFGELKTIPFNPISVVIGLGVITMVFDLKDYAKFPKPKPLLVGAVIVPFWGLLRFWVGGKTKA